MQVKYQIPIEMMLISSSEDDLNKSINFDHDDYHVVINLIGDKIYKNEKQEIWKYSRDIEKFEFQIDDKTKKDNRISELIVKNDKNDLLKLLRSISNRLLFSFRHFGPASGIHELNTNFKKPEYYLYKWKIQFTKDGKAWEDIIDTSEYEIMVNIFTEEATIDTLNKNILSTGNISTIEEAIVEKYTLDPEQEFITNSLEHFKNNNLRLSLIEAIIGLEVVLSQSIKIYLKEIEALSNGKIKSFLKNDLGLTAKVSVMLHLIFSKDDLDNLDIPIVLIAINMRNNIIHGGGSKFSNYKKEDIEEAIRSVWKLVKFLSKYYKNQLMAPGLDEIASAIENKPHVVKPTIKYINRHNVYVRFTYVIVPLPEIEIITKTIEKIIKIFKKKDKYFDKNNNLVVEFYFFGDIKHLWANGKFLEIKQSEK